MANVFGSPWMTLERAKHHIRDFDAVIKNFIDPSPWAYIIDSDTKPGEEIHKIVFTRELPYGSACILFDIANNLRAVLDQSGYAAAVASGKESPGKTAFPFGKTAHDVDTGAAGWAKDVPPEIRALFKGFKPYKGGNDLLYALNQLCNTKKHCALVPLFIAEPTAHFQGRLPPEATIGFFVDPDGCFRGWNSEKRELVLATVPKGGDPDIRGHFAFQIAIDGIEALRSRPAIEVINDISGIVESIMRATEAECRRLGFVT